jgi:hypothetical protein
MLEYQKCILGYIDPGAGSLIVQMLIASCIGTITVFRRAIFGFFGKKSNKAAKDVVGDKSLGKTRDDKSEQP